MSVVEPEIIMKLITKNSIKLILSSLLFFSNIRAEDGHDINFKQVPISEFIRFVSKISEVNFIFDHQDLQFNVSFSSGKKLSSEHVLQALIQLLRVHGFGVMQKEGYYVVHKLDEIPGADGTSTTETTKLEEKQRFAVFKLQYHQGSEIQESIKNIASNLKDKNALNDAIQSMQWVKATNSLLCSGDEETLDSLKSLISSLDIPLRQVFIEILVIETDVRKGLDFGLQWGARAKYNNKGVSNRDDSGIGKVPVGSGFDLGVIGDIITHRGKSFFSLSALVSALQADQDSTIVLNQKIITQDNKNSKIFVGDNIPFPGSIVQTIGTGQQTTSNIEYRDIGVSLSITPMLGEGDIITLDLDEEISEAVNTPAFSKSNVANGIRSTKTNMVTHVHVPDKHFLVLSGMVRNTKSFHKEGIPCLGSIPLIGSLFSKTQKDNEKRNVIVFVRPHIIHSFEDYDKITQHQEDIFKVQANPESFQEGVDLLKN